MKTMLKRVIVISFVLTMMCSLTMANAAMPEEDVVPLYNFITATDCYMEVYDTLAQLVAHVKADADKCQIKMTLQMHNGASWVDVDSWTEYREADSYTMYKTYTINPNVDYRIKVTFKVWNGSSTETVTRIATP